MTAKIKLNAASGGGSFSLQAPSSSSNNRVFTIPDVADGTIATTATSGKILQVVSAIKTDTASASLTSNSDWVGHGLAVSITPSSASNKILITGFVTVGSALNEGVSLSIFKDGSVIAAATGNADASSKRQHSGNEMDYDTAVTTIPLHYLDTAGGTSAISYAPAINVGTTGSNTLYLNRISYSATDNTNYVRTVSVITAMEVSV